MDRPLHGVRVLDLGQIYNGPYSGLILAYLGAEVIKVERPEGEIIRSRAENRQPPNLRMLNSSKKGITLNLKSEEGKEAFRDLVKNSDVVVENFSRGVMENLDLGYKRLKELNPGLIYAHGSGYGESGPYADYPAMDLTIQAISGAAHTTGFPDGPPTVAGPAFADFMAGIHLAAGVVSALFRREKTGEGQYVDVAMMDCIYPSLASPLSAWVREKGVPQRTGNRQSGLSTAPYNIYEAEDGYIAIICVTDDHWERFLKLAGKEGLLEDKRYSTKVERANHMEEVDQIVREWLEGRTKGEAKDLLLKHNIPGAPVQSLDEVVEDPQLHHRDMIKKMPNIGEGKTEIPCPGMPIKFPESNDADIQPSPGLGEHTEEILESVAGYSPDQIEEMKEKDAF